MERILLPIACCKEEVVIMKRFEKLCKIAALLLCSMLAFGGCGKDGGKGGSGSGKDAVSDTEQLMAYKDIRYLPKFTDTSGDYNALASVGVGFSGIPST